MTKGERRSLLHDKRKRAMRVDNGQVRRIQLALIERRGSVARLQSPS